MSLKHNASKITAYLFRKLQKIFITATLFVIYIFGFGITYVMIMIFNRKMLKRQKKSLNTFWKDAEGYEGSIEECTRES